MTPYSLEAAAESAFLTQGGRAVIFDHDGRRYVAKQLAEKPRRLTQTLFMRWLVKNITGQPLPLRTLALSDAAGSMEFEANRLKSLSAAGVRVPRVAVVTPKYFVLDYCGIVVASLLEKWSSEEWRTQLPRFASELGEFHKAGHWHGGAQIKNITMQDGISYRIDFEENFGEFLPLTVTQAADLALFLNSVSLAGPIVESEARQLMPKLLDSYFAANPNPEIKKVIARALPLLKSLAGFAGLFQRWSKKGIRRVIILVDVLKGVK